MEVVIKEITLNELANVVINLKNNKSYLFHASAINNDDQLREEIIKEISKKSQK